MKIKNISRAAAFSLVFATGLTAIIASRPGPGTPTYIRVDDPTFSGRQIYDVAEAIVSGTPTLTAVGEGGSWTTVDGNNWSFHSGETKVQLISRSNEFFAVTDGGNFRKSADGQNWTAPSLERVQNVNHVVRGPSGSLIVAGMSLNQTSQFFFPTVWLSPDAQTWQRRVVGNTLRGEVYSVAAEGSLIVAGGGYRPINAVSHIPLFWYSENGGTSWTAAGGPYSSESGIVREIVHGTNNVFYANTTDFSNTAILWKSTDGKSWQIVQDSEVSAAGEFFAFRHSAPIGSSNATAVVGERAGVPALWSYVWSSDNWRSGDLAPVFGSDIPTKINGIGLSPNVVPGYVYTGTRMDGGSESGAIWVKR